jgi:hypothetical protein
MADRKGLIAPVKLAAKFCNGWEIFNLPLDDQMLAGLKFHGNGQRAATRNDQSTRLLARHLHAGKAGDTFLDLRTGARAICGSTAIASAVTGTSARRKPPMRPAAGCTPVKMKS